MIRVNRDLLKFVGELARAATGGGISEQKFAPKKIVLEQGARVCSVYVVKSGIAKCYLMEENGAQFIQEFFGEGEIFGEIEIFNDNETFGAIEALTELVAYKIARKNFERLLAENAGFNRLILSALAAKIKYKSSRHSFNQMNPIEANLLNLKSQFPDFLKIISKHDVANYLGVTERSLNRSLKRLKEQNLID